MRMKIGRKQKCDDIGNKFIIKKTKLVISNKFL